jgi:hypothetical protein
LIHILLKVGRSAVLDLSEGLLVFSDIIFGGICEQVGHI